MFKLEKDNHKSNFGFMPDIVESRLPIFFRPLDSLYNILIKEQ